MGQWLKSQAIRGFVQTEGNLSGATIADNQ